MGRATDERLAESFLKQILVAMGHGQPFDLDKRGHCIMRCEEIEKILRVHINEQDKFSKTQ